MKLMYVVVVVFLVFSTEVEKKFCERGQRDPVHYYRYIHGFTEALKFISTTQYLDTEYNDVGGYCYANINQTPSNVRDLYYRILKRKKEEENKQGSSNKGSSNRVRVYQNNMANRGHDGRYMSRQNSNSRVSQQIGDNMHLVVSPDAPGGPSQLVHGMEQLGLEIDHD